MTPVSGPQAAEAFAQSLAFALVVAGKPPDQAARLARATWAELYPAPAPEAADPHAAQYAGLVPLQGLK